MKAPGSSAHPRRGHWAVGQERGGGRSQLLLARVLWEGRAGVLWGSSPQLPWLLCGFLAPQNRFVWAREAVCRTAGTGGEHVVS